MNEVINAINPIISVVTVSYNAVDLLENTILSVINQTYPYIEYIVIDGGSIDGTVDIIRKYTDRIAYWISEPDMGIYDAMNKGIQHATGHWIININAGDVLFRIPVEDLSEALVYPYSAVCGQIVSENNQMMKPIYNWRIKLRNTLPHQALFYRLIDSKMCYDSSYRIVADYAYNLQMYLGGKKILIINEIISFHSLEGVSSSKSSALESLSVIKKECGILFYILSLLYRKACACIFYIRFMK